MKLLPILCFLVAYLQLSSAWVLQVHGNKKKKDGMPVSETFHSRKAENDCYDFSTEITSKGVHDFRFCTIQMYQCEIAFFDQHRCRGKKLGQNGGRGYSWRKNPVSKAGSKMKSFRISGCILGDLPGNFNFDKFNIRDC